MARLEILEYPDPRLRLQARPVTAFDADLGALVDDLIDTVRETRSIGLSAPQVNVPQQVLVTDLSGDGSAPQVFVNPEILATSALGLIEESCLSVPGIVANVIRPTEVRVRAHDRHGEPFERDLSGMDAVCLQHEMDHLVGRLFVDRLTLLQKLRYRGALARLRRRRDAA